MLLGIGLRVEHLSHKESPGQTLARLQADPDCCPRA